MHPIELIFPAKRSTPYKRRLLLLPLETLSSCLILEGGCGKLPSVKHARLVTSSNSSPFAVLYACETGYLPQGSGLVRCIHGRWTNPRIKCLRE